MGYECDHCGAALPAGVRACAKCGETFEDAVPADAEVPRRGFSAVAAQPTPRYAPPAGTAGPYFAVPPMPPVARSVAPSGGSSGLRIIGCLILIGGLMLAGYYFLVFDTSVQVPTTEVLGQTVGGERVNNLGLMSEKQNGIVMGMAGAILGAILMYAGRKK